MHEPGQQSSMKASRGSRLRPAERIAWLRARAASGWRRAASDSLLVLAAVVLATSVLMAAQLQPRRGSSALAYLLVIVALACTRGHFAAILAALLASFAYNLFLSHRHVVFAFPQLNDLLDPLVLLATAVLGGQLTATVRRHFQQAQERAVLQERQRLAYELHDSVYQDLYSISLGIHTVREALECDPGEAIAPLEYVMTLTETGLAEMRALIFELRPESLATEGIIAALTKQVTVLRTHYQLAVDAQLGEEPTLSLQEKQALYRIAQEALHNIVKHAGASTVTLRLTSQEGEVILEIRDDGYPGSTRQGFDPTGPFPDHPGLHSIQEHAARLGGTCSITCAPAQGTCLRVRIPTRHQPGGK